MGNPRPKSEVYSPKIPLGKEVESKACVSMDSKTAGITSAVDSSVITNTHINKALIGIKSILSGIIKHSHFFNVQKPSVGVLENEDGIELGKGLTVRQVYGETISGFNPMDELMFQQEKQKILAEDNSEETQAEISAAEKELEEKKANLEKYILDLKFNTSVDINSVIVYNDALANSLCAKYGMEALICSKGILLANGQEQNLPLLCKALKKLGENYSNFILKGQGTWYLHYKRIPEILPIFRLVADSKKKLLDKFNNGDFFYKVGTSILQGGFWPWGTHSLDKADKLEKVYQSILEAAIKDSEKCYVPFGKGTEGKNAFMKEFETSYDEKKVEAASEEAKKLIYLVEPIEKFREYGTPGFNTFWRDDKDLKDEMELHNGYLLEMLDSMGVLAGEAEVKDYTKKANEIISENDPKNYDEWRVNYVKGIYDELDDVKELIEKNAKSKLINAYGKYGEFYYNVIDEIKNSEKAAFLIEIGASILIGGGTGAIAKQIGTVAIKQGAKLVTKNTLKQGAKFVAKESVDSFIFTEFANVDRFEKFGGRDVSHGDVLLSASIGTGVSSFLGGGAKLLKFLGGNVIKSFRKNIGSGMKTLSDTNPIGKASLWSRFKQLFSRNKGDAEPAKVSLLSRVKPFVSKNIQKVGRTAVMLFLWKLLGRIAKKNVKKPQSQHFLCYCRMEHREVQRKKNRKVLQRIQERRMSPIKMLVKIYQSNRMLKLHRQRKVISLNLQLRIQKRWTAPIKIPV